MDGRRQTLAGPPRFNTRRSYERCLAQELSPVPGPMKSSADHITTVTDALRTDLEQYDKARNS